MLKVVGASETSERMLDVAERLVQTRGFNGFSYADVSAELGITKASLHYHFRTKAELGESLVDRYQRRFLEALETIDRRHDHAREKLKAYVKIYASVLEADRMCLCGMLAADHATLPETIRKQVQRFFQANELWLKSTLSRGRAKNEVGFSGQPIAAARFLLGALEGAMLMARARESADHFRSTAVMLLDSFAIDRR